MAAAPTTPEALPEPKLGLRERKKIQTRQAIRRAAYRLFKEQGYDATPVDQIAAAADISPSTVFRYFPTKEDIVLTDEYDAMMEAALRARPPGEPAMESIRHTVIDPLCHVFASEREEMVERTKLLQEVPALRARASESQAESGRILAEVLCERTGRPSGDVEVEVVVGAVLGGFQAALMHWARNGNEEDLIALMEQALDVLIRGLTL
ncbi:TetR/AcrR family transcriptional regulator [Streptomyces sp. NPDC057654]|uniref:TetR/AcrR family transcriptional regulator n=1 Tax=Streptomyces sp. NPDC057654 TaxID=3346196 RepID=UPI0036B229F7